LREGPSVRPSLGAVSEAEHLDPLSRKDLAQGSFRNTGRDVFPQGEAAEVSIKRIQDLVAERFDLMHDELCGEKRPAER
jgi:chromosomal replication initiation ATPase DnaA